MVNKTPGYHIRDIKRGEFGKLSKIREELEEAEDAEEQGAKLMVLHELSDMIGAIDGYIKKEFPDFSLADLLLMSMLTQRAFTSGKRRAR